MVSRISLIRLVFTFALVTSLALARPNSEDLDERGKAFTEEIPISQFTAKRS
jgi:hypothetical protein